MMGQTAQEMVGILVVGLMLCGGVTLWQFAQSRNDGSVRGLVGEGAARLLPLPVVVPGALRRRFLRALTSRFVVMPSGAREAFPHLEVRVAPEDLLRLVPDGDRQRLAADAALSYVRHARRQQWAVPAAGVWVRVVPDQALRPGWVPGARPVRHRSGDGWQRATADGGKVGGGAAAVRRTERMDGRPEELLTVPMGAGTLILEGDFAGRQAVLRDATVVGRGGECQLRCRAGSVSRRHVSVYPQNGAWWVRDLGSTNGTRLNGRDIAGAGPARLAPGNRLVLGSGVALSVTRIACDVDQETQPMDGPR